MGDKPETGGRLERLVTELHWETLRFVRICRLCTCRLSRSRRHVWVVSLALKVANRKPSFVDLLGEASWGGARVEELRG
ncbi:hypothetical protein U1Q18_003078 [Sarracenia purpurea var. burkii]